MTTLTIDVPDDVAERLEERARAEGRASAGALLGEVAEREADLGGSRLERFHRLIREGYDSPSSPLPEGYFAGRKAALAGRVRAGVTAAGNSPRPATPRPR